MRRIASFIAGSIFVLASAAPALPQETPWDVLTGFPAYVSMQTYHAPSPASVMGKTKLFYEIYVLNAYGAQIDVSALTVRSGLRTIASFGGPQLASMMRPLGRKDAPPSRAIAAAETAVFYVELPFAGPHDVPKTLDDTLTFTVPQAPKHVFTVDQKPIAVSPRPPVVIEPPLHGTGWFAGSGPSNASGHRRTIFFKNGLPYLAQRFAIDWVQGKIDAKGHLSFFHGDPKQNANWYCWNQPLYAVADGVVVGERTDLPDNVPLSPPVVRVNEHTIGGNYIVLDIGYGRYAFYAHLRPHSATVKVGDRVKAGQVIGRLGNSGNSTGPHLHFHVTDAAQFIFADGEPYAFASMRASPSTFDDERPEDGAQLEGPLTLYRNTMPGDGTVVDFGPAGHM
jgi:hypothetical protein